MRFFKAFVAFIVLFIVSLPSASSCSADKYQVVIHNPYKGLQAKIRQRAMSHEHISNQAMLEDAINRGIDILCISNYSPAVPAFPINEYSYSYEDWDFVIGDDGNIVYERDTDGAILTKRIGTFSYKIPKLIKISKISKGGFEDFNELEGTYIQLQSIPQLPNSEHTHYTWSDGITLSGDKHVNIIGTLWGEAGNGSLNKEALSQYNKDNQCDFTSASFRIFFPLWSIQELVSKAKDHLLFPGKVFGTINHPGYSKMQDWHVDEYLKYGSDVFKAMSVFNNSVSKEDNDSSIGFYDHTIMRGIKLWCVAENDWGRMHDLSVPQNRGCNLLYLDTIFNSLSPEKKAEMALDAYISGSFSAVGYGTIDLVSAQVEGDKIIVTFNCIPDKTIIDIDGHRYEIENTATITVPVNRNNHFVRFEAYKGDDFIFTQPFYVETSIVKE